MHELEKSVSIRVQLVNVQLVYSKCVCSCIMHEARTLCVVLHSHLKPMHNERHFSLAS